MPTIKERIKSILRPAETGKLAAQALVDRYETIKLDLIRLGAKLENFGIRDDEDGKFVTEYILSSSKRNADAVKALLDKAEIPDLTNTSDRMSRLMGLGMAVEQGALKDQQLQREVDTQQFIIYRGKYMSPDDSKRLRSNFT